MLVELFAGHGRCCHVFVKLQIILLLLVRHLEDFLHPLNGSLLVDLKGVLHGLY